MVIKTESNLFPTNYHINLFRKLQNLKQKDSSIKDYIEEVHWLSIRVSRVEDDTEKVSKYLNCLCIDLS